MENPAKICQALQQVSCVTMRRFHRRNRNRHIATVQLRYQTLNSTAFLPTGTSRLLCLPAAGQKPSYRLLDSFERIQLTTTPHCKNNIRCRIHNVSIQPEKFLEQPLDSVPPDGLFDTMHADPDPALPPAVRQKDEDEVTAAQPLAVAIHILEFRGLFQKQTARQRQRFSLASGTHSGSTVKHIGLRLPDASDPLPACG